VPGIDEGISKLKVAPGAVGEQIRDDDASLLGALAKALADAGLLIRDHQFSVEDGVATIRGRLEARADIPRATEIAQNVPGIRRVRNFLRASADVRGQGGA
jgi:osmotically-inducible protein OsmY